MADTTLHLIVKDAIRTGYRCERVNAPTVRKAMTRIRLAPTERVVTASTCCILCSTA